MDKKECVKKLVGSNIRRFRELIGLSQEQLAEKIGVNPPAISEMECGKRYPKPENISNIAKVFNITIDMLFQDNSLPLNVEEDFQRRYELIKNNPEKFNILYNVLKILS